MSYFGMRKFSIDVDSKGKKRLFLNNKPYFHNGLLDQGYWSDGYYTAPSDEALIYDIQKMKEELEYRLTKVRPEILEDVKLARSHGDLSENAEYHAAKRERGKNESRIRYLRNMIKTAVIIDGHAEEGVVGLYDKVTVYIPDDDEEEVYQIVTDVRYDVSSGFISKESPFGKAVLGKKLGDTCTVQVNPDYGYDVIIKSIEKMEDDDTAPLASY
jgi:transcription elongation factor GreA